MGVVKWQGYLLQRICMAAALSGLTLGLCSVTTVASSDSPLLSARRDRRTERSGSLEPQSPGGIYRNLLNTGGACAGGEGVEPGGEGVDGANCGVVGCVGVSEEIPVF